ncbi:hypothetical protein SISNIDRAFT_553028 [Sistotremastrum niveocremeum HHB9708]|uniref:Ricin B lectin domain-containing protein n=1 Tax=Sistotremastrum niveocremeum HHB9708 TaxID=1314777 RepID=A0A164NGI4_9AGAM|nr:hypothetical protein SISNIDRAFT_553028 [Sistotremastrum niveocremeum HHB9708]
MALASGVYDIVNIAYGKRIFTFKDPLQDSAVGLMETPAYWWTKYEIKRISGNRYTIKPNNIPLFVAPHPKVNKCILTNKYTEWNITPTSDGTYRISKPYDDLYLFSISDSGIGYVYSEIASGGPPERWRFEKANSITKSNDNGSSSPPVDDGSYDN